MRRRKKTADGHQLVLRNFVDNLSADERTALAELKNNVDVIIKPADKGSATVVMDKSAYIVEAHRQLNNTTYYKRLDRPIYTDNVERINAVLDELSDQHVITPKQLRFLRAKETDRQRIFYLLPKIHKPRSKWPQADRMPEGRPIVSDVGSESYRVSQYVDSFIRPISVRHPSYIKDTYDFVAKVRGQHIPKDALLVTGDVCSLYTNMRIDRIIEKTRLALRKHPAEGRPDAQIIDLLNITLRNNDFAFNGEIYLQICGTAMGKTYAPGLADIYLEEFDEVANTGFQIKPLFYFRFLDDTFFVWPGTTDQLREYESFLNTIIDGITITLNVSTTSVDFLDTTVFKTNRDVTNANEAALQTKVFFKETDTHQLLHKDSFHPQHTTKGVLKSQILRFQRISSTYEDFSAACLILFRSLQKRRYSARLMRKMKVDIWRASQSTGVITIDPNVIKDHLLPVIVPFNEIGTELAKRWRNTIQKNELFQCQRVITAYKAGKSLRRNLVRSLLSAPSRDVRLLNTQRTSSGTTRCTNPRCRVCNYIKPGVFVRSHINCHQFNTIGRINCKTSNVIYLISCKLCNQQYVGETSRPLADRVNTHLSCIRLGKETPVALHFNMTGHSLSDFNIAGIEVMTTNDSATRKMKESTWQNILQTAYPLGINNLQRRYI